MYCSNRDEIEWFRGWWVELELFKHSIMDLDSATYHSSLSEKLGNSHVVVTMNVTNKNAFQVS